MTRLTKFNHETDEYEYKERAKTQEEFIAQRKAVIQRLGEFEDRAEGEWISVNERLPSKDDLYLVHTVFNRKDYIEIERCVVIDEDDGEGEFAYFENEYVAHWMPLPQPPKMKGECDEQRNI